MTSNRLHYTVDDSIIDPNVDRRSWRLRVEGLVGRPIELGYDELLAMASTEQYVTLQCISNLVGGDLVGTAKWTGVPLARVLARAGGVGRGPCGWCSTPSAATATRCRWPRRWTRRRWSPMG